MTGENAAQNARDELTKARTSLRAARALAAIALWDDAVSRAYYAAFHAASACLLSTGIDAKSHQGVHDLFFAHFVAHGPLPRSLSRDLAALQRFREQADDGTSARFDETTAQEEVERATQLVDELAKLLASRGVTEPG